MNVCHCFDANLRLLYMLFSNLAAMIHWTRQIKELLNNQDAHETSENAGPLEEIAFWRGRCNDLLGISDQLDKPGVKQIVSILTLAKSSYVGPFLKLSKLIQVSICSQFSFLFKPFYVNKILAGLV